MPVTQPATPRPDRSIWIGVRRGLAKRCPVCGKGRLFSGFLKVSAQCDCCASDNTIYPSDDFPPYLTILVAGHVLVPLVFIVERTFAPPLWVQAAIWSPVTLALCLLLLPVMKGGTVGLCWATGLVRDDAMPGDTRPH